MSGYYDEYKNDYYNPDDNDKKPGENENWKMIQKGFSESAEKDDDQDSDISGLKSRMTAAEGDIDTLEGAVAEIEARQIIQDTYLFEITNTISEGWFKTTIPAHTFTDGKPNHKYYLVDVRLGFGGVTGTAPDNLVIVPTRPPIYVKTADANGEFQVNNMIVNGYTSRDLTQAAADKIECSFIYVEK